MMVLRFEEDKYTVLGDMRRVKNVEIELLVKLLEVCNKYSLKIWAEGGTLLGAVREKGFIPWDDDIDMAMPREDFDKLRLVAKDEFKDPFFFQSGYTDMFPNGMAKLRKDNTAAIERASVFVEQHHGIFVDIFPLDIMPDDEKEFNTFVKGVAQLKEELRLFCNHNYSITDWKYDFGVLKKILKIKLKGFHVCFEEYDSYVKKYKDTSYKMVSLIAWYYNSCYLRERQWYSGTKYIPFEDMQIPVPSGFHEILKRQFGEDYMTPIQKPAMHDGFICLSVDHSYKEFLPYLRKKYRKEKWVERWKKLICLLKC